MRCLAMLTTIVLVMTPACAPAPSPSARWEQDNPVVPLPEPPLGVEADFASLEFEVTPGKVRLGRWLFHDKRLSTDGTVSCATCHRPENAFSEPTPHSTGVGGKTGNRKSPTFVNGAWPLYDVYFWDGRAGSLQEQAKGPIVNPVEMANSHETMIATLEGIQGYAKYFEEVYGDARIDLERVVDAIAAYEATRLSGGSAWDRYQAGEKDAISAAARLGDEIFFGKGECAQCHLGWNFSDSMFHNLGVGWDEASGSFVDVGRAAVTNDPNDTGAFKTPTLREVGLRAPYMHDGSVATLREAVEHYNKGGTPNPWLSERIRPLGLTPEEVDALVAMMEALEGVGYQDETPASFPQ